MQRLSGAETPEISAVSALFFSPAMADPDRWRLRGAGSPRGRRDVTVSQEGSERASRAASGGGRGISRACVWRKARGQVTCLAEFADHREVLSQLRGLRLDGVDASESERLGRRYVR